MEASTSSSSSSSGSTPAMTTPNLPAAPPSTPADTNNITTATAANGNLLAIAATAAAAAAPGAAVPVGPANSTLADWDALFAALGIDPTLPFPKKAMLARDMRVGELPGGRWVGMPDAVSGVYQALFRCVGVEDVWWMRAREEAERVLFEDGGDGGEGGEEEDDEGQDEEEDENGLILDGSF
ncbi:hypothetical protein BJ508DRAFT_312643 [Ascobolus immersus RN42]|uniref:Uncharacterized protein n=1 Tax=Ascobolus immersus RN42 TaxID=1160509 RepID=A0A3N4HLH3_ASCIM|nr:hypothetical protein BJ508DRAFT_312643 [Ascobolus immersus RN42]